MPQKYKVLLVDDHPLVREGLVNLINQQADLQVCAEASNEPKHWKSSRLSNLTSQLWTYRSKMGRALN